MSRIMSLILIIVSLIILSASISTFYTWNNYRKITPVLENQKNDLKLSAESQTLANKVSEIAEPSNTTVEKTAMPESTEAIELTESTESIESTSNTVYITYENESLETQESILPQATPNIVNSKNTTDKIFFTKADTQEKVIFITIDDGPGNYTMELLDLLKKYNIKAIFFVSGDTVLGYPEVLKREFEEGHYIGTHTYCHRSYYKLQKTADLETLKNTLRSDLQKTEENIKKILPEVRVRYLRMPEGYHKDWVDEIAKEFNYKVLNWTAGYDWLQEPIEKIIEEYKKSLKPGGIYLFHDGRDRGLKTVKILSELIPYALSQGYKFGDPKDYF